MNSFLRSIIILLSLCAFGCASMSSKKIADPSATSHAYIFPKGNYRHRVELVIPKTDSSSDSHSVKSFRFNGVVSLKPDSIQIVALSPFGTTVFKIDDDLKTNTVKDEIYIDQMKPMESKLLHYYSVLKELLLLQPKGSSPHLIWKKTLANGLPEEVEYQQGLDQALFLFKKYDEHSIPEEIEIKNPHFEVSIGVTGYAL